MRYEVRYMEYIDKAGARNMEPPTKLHNVIEQFHKIRLLLEDATEAEQKRFYPLLAKVDAVIAITVYRQFKDKIESEEKAKLLALRAKALQLKLNNQNGK